MMLQAIDQETGKLVLALNASKGRKYQCPECQEPLIWRHGRLTVAHFAHHKGSTCLLGAGETDEHLLGKQQLYQWARAHGWQPRLEYYLPAINQRPDLLLTVGQRKVALEFQCSPLSRARLAERNRGYESLGILPCWLLGQPYQHRLSASKIAQFTQLVNGTPRLVFWHTESKRLVYQRCGRVSLLAAPAQTRPAIVIAQTKRLQAALRRRDPRWRKLVLAAYAHHHLLAAMPVCGHDWRPRWPVSRLPLIAWRVRILLQLESYPLGYHWTRQGWDQLLIKEGKWLAFPCLSDRGLSLVKAVLADFTADLVSAGTMARNGQRMTLIKSPVWFPSIETKLGRLQSLL